LPEQIMARQSPRQAPAAHPEEQSLLQSIVDHPEDAARWLILADWLEENDDARRAELLRLHRKLIDTCCEPQLHPERAGQQARMLELLTEGVRPCVPRRTLTLGKGVEMTFAWIPPGSFVMGSSPDELDRGEDEVQHRVTLTRGFWLGLTPVTQGQWRAVRNYNPSRYVAEMHPVEQVLWGECQKHCRRLGKKVGKRLRLPTEAEWEYACRAGTTTPFFWGGALSTEQANYNGEHPYGSWYDAGYLVGGDEKGVCRWQTTSVGSFPAMPGAFSTCTATSGSGARTGAALLTKGLSTIRRGRIKAGPGAARRLLPQPSHLVSVRLPLLGWVGHTFQQLWLSRHPVPRLNVLPRRPLLPHRRDSRSE
jgi:uncharacterized protein (TIGR02996 family)